MRYRAVQRSAKIGGMVFTTQSSLQVEEQLVAELAQLGVCYLSRQNADACSFLHAPHELIAMLVCQPSSRVRTAVIALLLMQPDFAEYIPQALEALNPKDELTLRFFYTAAVNLQLEHAEIFQASSRMKWCKLPDLFSDELGLMGDSPTARLKSLAQLQAYSSGENLNWLGTYENVVQHLVVSLKRERTWKA
jgi:hypothetical protein